MDNKILKNIRTDYKKGSLLEENVQNNPLNQLQIWLNEAIAKKVIEPNAMYISTISELNKPSSRIVLLREIQNGALLFYTNYNSKKGNEIKANANVALLFFWPNLQRQIRIEGKCTKVNAKQSDQYFYSRPNESQLASIASPQSEVIKSKDELFDLFEKQKQNFAKTGEIKRPKNWGGFQIKPTLFEFWQGGSHRLHDRLQFTKSKSKWKVERLAP